MTTKISPDNLTEILTIDGPAGAGKSTIAKRLAKQLNFAFLDTGAMYRAATWWAQHNNIDMTDRDALTTSTQSIPMKIQEKDGVLTVVVGGTDVTEAIRTPEITNAIKCLDGIPAVRAKMVDLQRKMGSQGPTVADGRDMGTVVFPKAKWKVFLEASLEERTRRRAEELTQKGIPFEPETLKADIHARDENDRNRAISPLRPADNAWILDTSALTLTEVESVILKYVRDCS